MSTIVLPKQVGITSNKWGFGFVSIKKNPSSIYSVFFTITVPFVQTVPNLASGNLSKLTPVFYWDIPIKVLSYFQTIKDVSHSVCFSFFPTPSPGFSLFSKEHAGSGMGMRCVPAPHRPRCGSQPAPHQICHYALPPDTTGMHARPQLHLSVQALARLVPGWEQRDQEPILWVIGGRVVCELRLHAPRLHAPLSHHTSLKNTDSKIKLRISRWQRQNVKSPSTETFWAQDPKQPQRLVHFSLFISYTIL